MRHPAQSNLTAEAFRAAVSATLPPLKPGVGLGLAVSGGPDSTALAHLTARAFPELRLRVAVVDHGLRRNSDAEAKLVRERLQAFVEHVDILTWSPPFKVTTAKLERARLARFGLLSDWARTQGLLRVWLGHHADDQAETIALRLARGSGQAGARGMARRRVDANVIFERPLLDWSKQALIGYCSTQGLSTVSDPTNSDPSTARGDLRQRRTPSSPTGSLSITPLPLDHMPASGTFSASARGIVTDPMGHAWCRSNLMGSTELQALVAWVRGGFYAPSAERAAMVIQRLRTQPRASLHGCIIERRREGWTLISREARARRSLRPQQDVDGGWRLDDRWAISRPQGEWSLAGPAGLVVDPGQPARALTAIPQWRGECPFWDGTALRWADNWAMFTPRRPLLPWMED